MYQVIVAFWKKENKVCSLETFEDLSSAIHSFSYYASAHNIDKVIIMERKTQRCICAFTHNKDEQVKIVES